MKVVDWAVPAGSADWECDWKGSQLFQLRYFRSLSAADKFRAVENMCKTARYFGLKAELRRRAIRQFPHSESRPCSRAPFSSA